jgi:uncharacterized Zn finger protein
LKENEPMETERSGQSWDDFCKKYRVTDIAGPDDKGAYKVTSESGKTYTVRSRTRLDDMGSMFFEWSCDCPARGTCRHIDAVTAMRWAEAAASEDFDGMDIMERED